MYSILVKDPRQNNYRFLTLKVENTSTDVMSAFGIGTGRDDTIVYSTSSLEELETKYVELLKKYKATDIIPVNVLNYSTDIVWGFTEDTTDKDIFEQEDVDFSDFFDGFNDEDDEEDNTNADDSDDEDNSGNEVDNNGEETD